MFKHKQPYNFSLYKIHRRKLSKCQETEEEEYNSVPAFGFMVSTKKVLRFDTQPYL